MNRNQDQIETLQMMIREARVRDFHTANKVATYRAEVAKLQAEGADSTHVDALMRDLKEKALAAHAIGDELSALFRLPDARLTASKKARLEEVTRINDSYNQMVWQLHRLMADAIKKDQEEV